MLDTMPLHFEQRGKRWRARLNGKSQSWSVQQHGDAAKRLAKTWLKKSALEKNRLKRLAKAKGMLAKASSKKPAKGMLTFEERGKRWRARRNGMSNSWSEYIHGSSAKALALAWLRNPTTKGGSLRKFSSSEHDRLSTALIVKAPWTDLILDRKKTWEIRNQPTSIRGFVKLAESGTGKLVGQVRISDCIKIPKSEFAKHVKMHQVPSLKAVLGYNTVYAWVLKDAVRYANPPSYEHPSGAVIWVKL